MLVMAGDAGERVFMNNATVMAWAFRKQQAFPIGWIATLPPDIQPGVAVRKRGTTSSALSKRRKLANFGQHANTKIYIFRLFCKPTQLLKCVK